MKKLILSLVVFSVMFFNVLSFAEQKLVVRGTAVPIRMEGGSTTTYVLDNPNMMVRAPSYYTYSTTSGNKICVTKRRPTLNLVVLKVKSGVRHIYCADEANFTVMK